MSATPTPYVRASSGILYLRSVYEELKRGPPQCSQPAPDYVPLIIVVAVCGVLSAAAIALIIYFTCYRDNSTVEDKVQEYIYLANEEYAMQNGGGSMDGYDDQTPRVDGDDDGWEFDDGEAMGDGYDEDAYEMNARAQKKIGNRNGNRGSAPFG